MSTPTFPITNPRAHGLRGLSLTTAELPTDLGERADWIKAHDAALDEGMVIIKTQGVDALRAAIEAEEGETLKDIIARYNARGAA